MNEAKEGHGTCAEILALRQQVADLTAQLARLKEDNDAQLEQQCVRCTNLRVLWRTLYREEVKKLQAFQDGHVCYPRRQP
jgi:hypothetical protein